MSAPTLTQAQVAQAAPFAKAIGLPRSGGQKQVFPCEIDGTKYALKFLATEPAVSPDADVSVEPVDEVLARARREISIMEKCSSPHLVKLGPIGLTETDIGGQRLLYFSEEWIDGEDLQDRIRRGPLLVASVVSIGRHITSAVEELWTLRKVHRDIKPGNIMTRASTDEHVLLDLGLAFDLGDNSISGVGLVHGTLKYLSPEQMDYTKRRSLDFRSDLFALGVVMYEAATGTHPFVSQSMSSNHVLAAILTAPAADPRKLRPDLPESLRDIILRLLAKRPHLRYRRCEDLIADLAKVDI